MGKVYDQVCLFKAKYPGTITWHRLKKHARVVEEHLNPGEEPIYTFAGQETKESTDIFATSVICLTNKRILIGKDTIIGGYKLNCITPDLFNDMQVYQGIFWGRICIDTAKETIWVFKLDKHCLNEIETSITSFMMEEKKKYGTQNRTKE